MRFTLREGRHIFISAPLRHFLLKKKSGLERNYSKKKPSKKTAFKSYKVSENFHVFLKNTTPSPPPSFHVFLKNTTPPPHPSQKGFWRAYVTQRILFCFIFWFTEKRRVFCNKFTKSLFGGVAKNYNYYIFYAIIWRRLFNTKFHLYTHTFIHLVYTEMVQKFIMKKRKTTGTKFIFHGNDGSGSTINPQTQHASDIILVGILPNAHGWNYVVVLMYIS